MKERPAPRVVPPAHKFHIQLPFYTKFTFWQRVRIMLGCNLLQQVHAFSPHNPGVLDSKIFTTVTNELPPKEVTDALVQRDGEVGDR